MKTYMLSDFAKERIESLKRKGHKGRGFSNFAIKKIDKQGGSISEHGLVEMFEKYCGPETDFYDRYHAAYRYPNDFIRALVEVSPAMLIEETGEKRYHVDKTSTRWEVRDLAFIFVFLERRIGRTARIVRGLVKKPFSEKKYAPAVNLLKRMGTDDFKERLKKVGPEKMANLVMQRARNMFTEGKPKKGNANTIGVGDEHPDVNSKFKGIDWEEIEARFNAWEDEEPIPEDD